MQFHDPIFNIDLSEKKLEPDFNQLYSAGLKLLITIFDFCPSAKASFSYNSNKISMKQVYI